MVTSLLSETDAREVEAAIARVERATSAQLVVAVVPQSGEHWRGRLLVSLGLGFSAAFAFLTYLPARPPVWALAIEAGVALLSFVLLRAPAIQRWLVPPRDAEEAAHRRAFQLFGERGLYGTKGRTALLIFVSELERRVVLLGDAAIHAQLGQTGWQEEVQRLVRRIREGRLRDGLLEVLTELEPKLALAAPPLADGRNELPDAVLRQ